MTMIRMKDMLSYLIARDTMHQNQWLAALEELGGHQGAFPIPNSFPQEEEKQEFSYAFLGFQADGAPPVSGRWSEGRSIDGKGEFTSTPLSSALDRNPCWARPSREAVRNPSRCNCHLHFRSGVGVLNEYTFSR